MERSRRLAAPSRIWPLHAPDLALVEQQVPMKAPLMGQPPVTLVYVWGRSSAFSKVTERVRR